jgi:excinuclease ABC subunit B
MTSFKLQSEYQPTGDQPQAIEKLTLGIQSGQENQVLLGVTGSGKTFTMANVIQRVQKPTLIISHNKTLAAQLYQEFRDFFPENKVEYFVSYYDYYQPEAYVPQRDLYIEKEADINDEIDKLRLSATTSLLTHKDTIVVASVSCIYNLGSPIEYARSIIEVKEGMKVEVRDIIELLHNLHYERTDYDFKRSTYRVRGDTLDINLAYEEFALRLEFLNDRLVSIKTFDALTGDKIEQLTSMVIYPAKHYLMADERRQKAIEDIRRDLDLRLKELRGASKTLEAYRLEQRTNYDLELMEEIGYCNGIENYSRYFDGREVGQPPYTLLEFFKSSNNGDFLTIVDESHITIPQIRGMYNGDQARKFDFGGLWVSAAFGHG